MRALVSEIGKVVAVTVGKFVWRPPGLHCVEGRTDLLTASRVES